MKTWMTMETFAVHVAVGYYIMGDSARQIMVTVTVNMNRESTAMTNKRVKDRVYNRGYEPTLIGPEGGLVFTMTANMPRRPSEVLLSAQDELRRRGFENELRRLREERARYQTQARLERTRMSLLGVETTNMEAARFLDTARMYSSLGQPSDPAPGVPEASYIQAMEILRLRNEETRTRLEGLMRNNPPRSWRAR